MSNLPIATYRKDGQERLAYTPADKVDLQFDGWTLVTDADADQAPEVDANPASDEPDPTIEPVVPAVPGSAVNSTRLTAPVQPTPQEDNRK